MSNGVRGIARKVDGAKRSRLEGLFPSSRKSMFALDVSVDVRRYNRFYRTGRKFSLHKGERGKRDPEENRREKRGTIEEDIGIRSVKDRVDDRNDDEDDDQDDDDDDDNDNDDDDDDDDDDDHNDDDGNDDDDDDNDRNGRGDVGNDGNDEDGDLGQISGHFIASFSRNRFP
ncbi:hypothetical protein V1477_005017 [Vespula maculifrons]|uniref:Uncharacterized protein n=1 Tax=Vespula maculifrons TaxID=7453 RepID=A0ABD2CNJ7_VESMC